MNILELLHSIRFWFPSFSINRFDIEKILSTTDEEAIASDWRAVGEDFKKIIGEND